LLKKGSPQADLLSLVPQLDYWELRESSGRMGLMDQMDQMDQMDRMDRMGRTDYSDAIPLLNYLHLDLYSI
jgi:hypothetical protein